MAINQDYSAVRYKTNMTRQKVWELIKISAFYLVLFVALVADVYFYAYLGRLVITNACLLMIVIGLISHWKVPTERPNQIIAIKRNLFIYLGVLLLAYFALSMLNLVDANQLGVSLGLNTGQTQASAVQGWITMAVQLSMFMIPLAFISYEVKRIWTFYGFGFGHTTKRKRMEQLQKQIVR